MRKPIRALWAVSLSLCFAIQPLITVKAQTPDSVVDSDEFFQRASRNGPERDHSRKIEDLLKRMTLEEKVGQMTQLSIDQVTAGKDQAIKIDPAKLEGPSLSTTSDRFSTSPTRRSQSITGTKSSVSFRKPRRRKHVSAFR